MSIQMPRIPREEYPLRWERAKQVLKDNNLDLILAYSDDRFTYGNAYARYYGDLQTVFEDTLVMLLPDRDPVLLVGPETIGFAQERSAFTDIRVISEFAAEDEDYPYTTVTPLDIEGRKAELARIIGGAVITETTLKSAEEMLRG